MFCIRSAMFSFSHFVCLFFNVTWSKSFETDACMLMPLNFWDEMSGCLRWISTNRQACEYSAWSDLFPTYTERYAHLNAVQVPWSVYRKVEKSQLQMTVAPGISHFVAVLPWSVWLFSWDRGGRASNGVTAFPPAVVMSDQRRRFTRLRICSTLPLMLFFLFPSSAQMCLAIIFPCPVLCSCGLCVY